MMRWLLLCAGVAVVATAYLRRDRMHRFDDPDKTIDWLTDGKGIEPDPMDGVQPADDWWQDIVQPRLSRTYLITPGFPAEAGPWGDRIETYTWDKRYPSNTRNGGLN